MRWQVPVPSDMVGMIIGKQGENIRRIQMDTNTKIQFAEGCTVRISICVGQRALLLLMLHQRTVAVFGLLSCRVQSQELDMLKVWSKI